MVWVVSLSTTELSPRRLTAVQLSHGILSLVGFGNLVGPLVLPVLYTHDDKHDAVPKNISRRTSYHGV